MEEKSKEKETEKVDWHRVFDLMDNKQYNLLAEEVCKYEYMAVMKVIVKLLAEKITKQESPLEN